MKRSRKASLVMMGTVPFLLAACENSERALVYRNVGECRAANILSGEQCEKEFARAQTESSRVAPRYNRLQECAGDFGQDNCQQEGRYYVPRMHGMLVKDPRPDPEDDSHGASGGGGRYFVSQPLYQARDDKGLMRSADNTAVSKFAGPVSVKESLLQAKPSGKVVRRGGFGRAAAARAGG